MHAEGIMYRFFDVAGRLASRKKTLSINPGINVERNPAVKELKRTLRGLKQEMKRHTLDEGITENLVNGKIKKEEIWA